MSRKYSTKYYCKVEVSDDGFDRNDIEIDQNNRGIDAGLTDAFFLISILYDKKTTDWPVESIAIIGRNPKDDDVKMQYRDLYVVMFNIAASLYESDLIPNDQRENIKLFVENTRKIMEKQNKGDNK